MTHDAAMTTPTIFGDLNLKSKLHTEFTYTDAVAVFKSARYCFEKLIENFIIKNGKDQFDSSTFYNPQYKLIQNDDNYYLIVITPFGAFNAIEIKRKQNVYN